MIQALKGEIPQKQLYDKPELQNNKKQTVALILSSQGIIPPSEWNHDCDIQDNNCYTVEMYLRDYQLPVPNNWITDKSKGINKIWFQQAIYNEKITSRIIKSDEQNIDGFTIAMIQIINGKMPEDRFKHDPNIKNIYGMSVEDIMKQQGIDVPNEWKCNYTVEEDQQIIQNTNYPINQLKQEIQELKQQLQNTTQQLYQQFEDYTYFFNQQIRNIKKDIIYLKPDIFSDGKTYAMDQAQNGQIPDQQYYHNPTIQDNQSNTVAIYLIKNNIDVPIEWRYLPEFRLNDGQTTAMKLVQIGIIPSKEWNHNPELTNSYGHTVCYYLWNQGFQVPEQWQDQQYKNPSRYNEYQNKVGTYYNITAAMRNAINKYIPYNYNYHNPQLTDQNGHTVKYYLQLNGIQVPKQWETHDQ